MPQSNITHAQNNLLIQDLADHSELVGTQCQPHILGHPVPSRTIKPTTHKDQRLTAGLLEGISHFHDSLKITAIWRLVLIFLTTHSTSITIPMMRRPPKPQTWWWVKDMASLSGCWSHSSFESALSLPILPPFLPPLDLLNALGFPDRTLCKHFPVYFLLHPPTGRGCLYFSVSQPHTL